MAGGLVSLFHSYLSLKYCIAYTLCVYSNGPLKPIDQAALINAMQVKSKKAQQLLTNSKWGR